MNFPVFKYRPATRIVTAAAAILAIVCACNKEAFVKEPAGNEKEEEDTGKAPDCYIVNFIWDNAPESIDTTLEAKPSGYTVFNRSSQDIVMTVDMFEGCFRTVEFSEETVPHAASMMKEPESIEIPDGRLLNGAPVFSGVKTGYSRFLTELPPGLPFTSSSEVHFKPGASRFSIVWEFVTYRLGYTVQLQDKNSTKQIIRSGIFTSKAPTGNLHCKWEEIDMPEE